MCLLLRFVCRVYCCWFWYFWVITSAESKCLHLFCIFLHVFLKRSSSCDYWFALEWFKRSRSGEAKCLVLGARHICPAQYVTVPNMGAYERKHRQSCNYATIRADSCMITQTRWQSYNYANIRADSPNIRSLCSYSTHRPILHRFWSFRRSSLFQEVFIHFISLGKINSHACRVCD